MKSKTDSAQAIKLPAKMTADSMVAILKNIEDLLYEKPTAIYIDCASLEKVTSNQIGDLWQIYQKCNMAGATAHLLFPSRRLIHILRVLDLYELFQYEQAPVQKPASRFTETVFSQSYADEFHPELESIDKALENFLQFLSSLNILETTKFELQTIFYEVCTNIRNHSGMATKESILFTAKTNDTKIVVVFSDSGQCFDITKQSTDIDPEIAGKNRQKRGFGITLIRRLADKIKYISGRTGLNILLIEKKWS
jgi:anti-sigma regulatory factor (Ser/Thr protein kinase)/anti-anti-sigma regulatory factor